MAEKTWAEKSDLEHLDDRLKEGYIDKPTYDAVKLVITGEAKNYFVHPPYSGQTKITVRWECENREEAVASLRNFDQSHTLKFSPTRGICDDGKRRIKPVYWTYNQFMGDCFLTAVSDLMEISVKIKDDIMAEDHTSDRDDDPIFNPIPAGTIFKKGWTLYVVEEL